MSVKVTETLKIFVSVSQGDLMTKAQMQQSKKSCTTWVDIEKRISQ